MKYLKESTMLISSLAVFLGGALGGLIRLLITQIPYIGSSPWVIAGINIIGSFLLAYVGSRIPETYEYSLILKNFIGTGIIGGFTSFSTFILEISQCVNQSYVGSLIYTLTSLIMAYFAVSFGKRVGSIRGIN